MLDNAMAPSQTNPLRIDTAVNSSSYLRALIYVGLLSALVLLLWLAELSLWQDVVILVISAVVVSYLALSRPILLHLSQPPLYKQVSQDWQLLMRTGRGDELWLAELNNIHRYHWLITFEFMTVEPFKRTLTVTVFRDQVSRNEWRQLNILANISGEKIV
ncbi:hypothetical protein [Psychrobacter sp. P2G3]|uniref:hypothetical protein n=1 Tax=Psychrobacter sp. P2G3 TaxID=1699622 RepID=UPI000A4FA877|nr:hypothetical protein [Psychrobacter sp. P2G3]